MSTEKRCCPRLSELITSLFNQELYWLVLRTLEP